MEDSDTKIKLQLASALELYNNRQYSQCKKALGEIKMAHTSTELDLLIIQYKQSPNKSASIVKKLMDILIALNIKLYEDRPLQPANNPKSNSEKAPRISHELYYWNIIVLSQLVGNAQVTELITNEALHFTDSLRTQTSLMIIYQMLNIMQSSSRLASCISLIEKQNRLISRVKKLSKEEQTYRFMNQILFNKVLLKLGMIQGSKIMYMMKFDQNVEDKKEELEINEVNNISINVYQQLLHAEIQYHSKNYPQAIKFLSELLPQIDSLGKNKQFVKAIIDHNLAIILANYQQTSPARLLLKKSLTSFANSKQLENNNERWSLISKNKENIILSGLLNPNATYSNMFEFLKNCSNSNSYKFNYRKAQVCIKFYHELLANPQKVLASKEIHDFYETVYYYPNQPYFQQKSKNKNPNYTNGRYYYRRYVLSEWQNSGNEYPNPGLNRESEQQLNQVLNENGKEVKQAKQESKDKDKKKEKASTSKNSKPVKKQEEVKQEVIKQEPLKKADPYKARLNEVLNLGEWYLKQALTFLEKQKNIIVNLQGEEKGLTEQVNEKLYSEYIEYKSSIYSLLCYVYLCRRQWIKTVYYADKYQEFEKLYQLQNKNAAQQQIYYSVLTYKMEAFCELNRTHNAYEIMQDVINSIEYAESVQVLARSTANQQQSQTYLENMSQYNNFCFNISVLHSRDNKIPEAYQSIQKILQQMRLSPSNPQANIPMSMIQLLIHYNLRTSNNQSAIQLIKRRRILNVPGVISHYQPTLNVTK